jgi:molecular chaperone GrpE
MKKIFGKNNAPEDQNNENTNIQSSEKEEKTKRISASILLQNDQAILEQLDVLNKKIDSIDKNNKKFMMTASMNKNEALEKKNASMKMSMITMLDQLYILLDSIYEKVDNDSKNGISMTVNAINGTLYDAEIEEIQVSIGDEFDPNIHQCVETVSDGESVQDTISAVVKRGYRDLATGLLLRPADVIVNK